jgi:hypothetical protein
LPIPVFFFQFRVQFRWVIFTLKDKPLSPTTSETAHHAPGNRFVASEHVLILLLKLPPYGLVPAAIPEQNCIVFIYLFAHIVYFISPGFGKNYNLLRLSPATTVK